VDQRAGDGQPLRLPTGQPLGAGIGFVGEPDHVEHLVRGPVGHAVQRGEGADLLAGGQPLEERRRLQLDADAGEQVRVPRPGRRAEQADRAAVGFAKTLDNLQQGGLPRTVGPEDAEELAGLDLERDAVHGMSVPVPLFDVCDDDGGSHGRHLTVSRRPEYGGSDG
jgi:hypothetical protein